MCGTGFREKGERKKMEECSEWGEERWKKKRGGVIER